MVRDDQHDDILRESSVYAHDVDISTAYNESYTISSTICEI